MDNKARKVISRHQGKLSKKVSPPPTSTWMQYLKEKASPPPPENIDNVERMLKDAPEPQGTYNPYDYKDPSSKAKEVDGPPFVQEYPSHPIYNRPDMYDGAGSVLERYYRSRRRDWTDDPATQYPQIDITWKHASVSNVVASFLLESQPLCISPEDVLSFYEVKTKEAASLQEVINKDTHYKNRDKMNRSRACRATWANKGAQKQVEKGYMVFKVSCGGSPDTHTVVFQFLRPEGSRRPNSYADYPMQVACSCESFLYFGAQFYAVSGGYMYMPRFRRSLVPPTPHTQTSRIHDGKRHPGRGLNFRVCKHILAAYNTLKTWRIQKYYKSYPLVGAPSLIMNKDEWKKLMKFEFSKENIKSRLKAGKSPPAFFRGRTITPAINEWFNNVWSPRTDQEKIEVLQNLVEHPEEIFFLLSKDAYLRNGDISNRLIDKGYELMSKVVQPDNEEEPKQEKMEGVPEEQQEVGEGTGIVIPGEELEKAPKDEKEQKGEPAEDLVEEELEEEEEPEEPEEEEDIEEGNIKRPTTIKSPLLNENL